MLRPDPVRLCSLFAGGTVLLSLGCGTGQVPRPVTAVGATTQPVALHASPPEPTRAITLTEAPTTAPAMQPVAVEDPELQALCMPPAGWIDKGKKEGNNHIRRLWINPAGTIGYSVVRARLPLPVGESMVLSAFLSEVQKMQGKTTIIEKHPSDEGLTFVAQSPVLRYEGRVHCKGLRGWIVFASSLTDKPIDPENLKMAEAARDATVLGR